MSYTYSAFISYRHLPLDMAAARAVQQALETWRIPRDIRQRTGVNKLNRCFRDQDELPLANDLGDSIEKALQESEWLIVICTPDLPKSDWCLREIDYFISLGRRDRIIPVLVSGEPDDSYPPQILRASEDPDSEEVEPLAADLRGNMGKHLRTEKLRIAARMLNLNYNDLKKREKERALRRGLIAVSVFLCAALAFAAYALRQNQLLAEQRNASTRSATELLIEKSLRSTAGKDLGSGLIYALKAYDSSRLFEQEYDASVSAALEAAMYPEICSQIGSLKDNGVLHRSAYLSNDGRYVACFQADRNLQVFDSVSGEKRYTIRDFDWLWLPVFSPDSQYICRYEAGTSEFFLYHTTDGSEALRIKLPEGTELSRGRLTVKNELPLRRTEDGAVILWDPFTGKDTVLEGIILPGSELDTVLIHRDGRRGAWTDGNKVWLADLETGKTIRILEGTFHDIYGEYKDDTDYLRCRLEKDYVYLRWENGEDAYRGELGGELSPDGKLIATSNGYNGFTLWDAATGEQLWTEGHDNAHMVYSADFAGNDVLIASHGEIQIYAISDRRVLYDSGKDRVAWGYDMAAGRLVMPLQAGGCLINLMPTEEDVLPHMIVESREAFDPASLFAATQCCPLAGTWNGQTFYTLHNGEWGTVQLEEPGLVYFWNDQQFVLHPVHGAGSVVFVSPDNKWQAMIIDQAVDIFRAQEGPEPVMTIPGNGYSRLWAGLYGDILALGAYVENLVLYDLSTGECIGTLDTGAMCMRIQFSADGKHLIAFSGMSEDVSVISMKNMAIIMRIPVANVRSVYNDLQVGFNKEGTEAIVLYPDGHADVGLLYPDLDSLVNKAQQYTK